MPKYSMTLNQKVHRNYLMFQDYISGRSIIKISRKYGLTYDRTRTIIKEHIMRQYFVVDHADDFILYRGTLEDCETALEENYAGLMIVGYRDLTPAMLDSLKNLNQVTKD